MKLGIQSPAGHPEGEAEPRWDRSSYFRTEMSAAQVRPCRDCAVRSNKHCFACGRAARDVQVLMLSCLQTLPCKPSLQTTVGHLWAVAYTA